MKLGQVQLGFTARYAVAVGILVMQLGVAWGQAIPLAFPISEPPFSAELANIDREWNLSFKTKGKVRVVAAGDLAYWGRYLDVEAGPQIVLADGSVIRADVLLVDDKQFVLGDATGLGRGFWDESSLPRDAVRGVMFQPPADAADRDRLLQQITSYVEADDRLLLVGSEAISGRLISMPSMGRFAAQDARPENETFGLTRRGSSEALVIPARKVIAVSFGAVRGAAADQGRMSTWLGFKDGSLVRSASVSVKGDVVATALAAGGELKTTFAGRDDPEKRFWDAVVYVEPVGQRMTWLSDVESLGFKHIPFLSVERPHGLDHSVLGSRLRAGGAVFRKGIGMPSASRLAYEVGGYRRFEAEVAVDAAAGVLGSVAFKVLLESPAGEWRTAYQSPVVRGGDVPIPISVDLKSASRMALLVEFAERGDECDYADWLNARLTK